MMQPVIRTFTGRQVNPFDLRPEDIDIRDIAHSLAFTNRFIGHTCMPISTAYHSWWASKLVPPQDAMAALLHDAAEYALGDVTKWVKHQPEMAAFREIEDRAQAVILEKFGCSKVLPASVEWADRLLVRWEGTMGFGSDFKIDHPNYPALTGAECDLFTGWRFTEAAGWFAANLFLERFFQIQGGALEGAGRAAEGGGRPGAAPLQAACRASKLDC
jgi:hypothetical protein